MQVHSHIVFSLLFGILGTQSFAAKDVTSDKDDAQTRTGYYSSALGNANFQDGLVFVRNVSGDQMWAYDGSTGRLRWQTVVPHQELSVRCAVVDGNLLVVVRKPLGEKDVKESSKYGTVLCAFNPLTGKRQWQFDIGIKVGGAPVYVEDTAYFIDQYTACAFDIKKRAILWTKKFPMDLGSAPLLANSSLVVTTPDGDLLAIDRISGTQNWNRISPEPFRYTVPLACNDSVFIGLQNKRSRWIVAAQPSDQAVFCLDATTGKVRWKKVISSFYGSPRQMAAGQKVLYVADSLRTLYALSRRDGTLLWKTESQEGFQYQTLMTAHGILYAASFPYLLAIEEANGNEVWKEQPEDGTYCLSPIVARSQVFTFVIRRNGGYLDALDATTGQKKWSTKMPFQINGLPPEASPIVASQASLDNRPGGEATPEK